MMMKRVLRLVFCVIVKRLEEEETRWYYAEEKERIITRIRKRKTQTSRDRENVSKTKETRERKICALTRTRCAPGTTLAEAVVGHQSSLFSLLNFFVRSKKICRWFSLVSRELTCVSPQLQKRENKSALSLSLCTQRNRERKRSLCAWIWCENAWNVFASSFAKGNVLFLLLVMLCGQLHLTDREREKKKSLLFLLFLLWQPLFSLLVFKNNELLLCFVVVVVVSEQQMCT